jgi:transposase
MKLEQELLSLLLPAGLTEYFELTQVEKQPDGHHLYLSQRNIPPVSVQDHRLESKGFYDEVTIRDFPLRGKACFLHLKRRKWWDHDQGKPVYSSWDSVAEGTRLTVEFAAFLKGAPR